MVLITLAILLLIFVVHFSVDRISRKFVDETIVSWCGIIKYLRTCFMYRNRIQTPRTTIVSDKDVDRIGINSKGQNNIKLSIVSNEKEIPKKRMVASVFVRCKKPAVAEEQTLTLKDCIIKVAE